MFVRGTTEAINLVAHAWGGKHLQPGDEIVITHLEHHANIVPWQLISQKTGAILKWAPIDDAGNLLLTEFEELLGPRTKLVAASQVSNALGTVVPVDKIVELGHRYGARVLIDGAQSIQHMPVDVAELGADFFVFSGHKIYGPHRDWCALWHQRSPDRDAAVAGRRSHDRRRHDWNDRCIRGRRPSSKPAPATLPTPSGSPRPCATCSGWASSASRHTSIRCWSTRRRGWLTSPEFVWWAPQTEKASVLSFVLAGHDPLEVGKALNAEGIAVRAGHHCAQPALRRLGLEATVRPSFAFYNTFEEIDVFLNAVRRIAEGGTNVG